MLGVTATTDELKQIWMQKVRRIMGQVATRMLAQQTASDTEPRLGRCCMRSNR